VVKQVTPLLCVWQVSGSNFALEVGVMTGVLCLCQDAQANVWCSTPVHKIPIHTLSNSLFTYNPAVGCHVVYAAAIIKM